MVNCNVQTTKTFSPSQEPLYTSLLVLAGISAILKPTQLIFLVTLYEDRFGCDKEVAQLVTSKNYFVDTQLEIEQINLWFYENRILCPPNT